MRYPHPVCQGPCLNMPQFSYTTKPSHILPSVMMVMQDTSSFYVLCSALHLLNHFCHVGTFFILSPCFQIAALINFNLSPCFLCCLTLITLFLPYGNFCQMATVINFN